MAKKVSSIRRRFPALGAAALAVVLLAACARTGPAPVVYRASGDPGLRLRADLGVGTVTVRAGDSLYLIGQRTGVSVRRLIEQNHLRPPYILQPGQRLTVPGRKVHVVVRGDTVYDISRRYGIDMWSLVRANGMAKPYTIFAGQKLRLPGARFAEDARPAKTGGKVGWAAKGKATAKDRTKGPAKVARVKLPPPPPRAGGRFTWPVRGTILSAFGAKPGGLHNDGINIAAKAGSPVRAADNGVVAYSGNELRGFGNLLLVKHAGGWMTAYAHNAKLLVARGTRVTRGQVIANAGATGSVTRPQLHFEIRKGKAAVDPSRYLVTLESRAKP